MGPEGWNVLGPLQARGAPGCHPVSEICPFWPPWPDQTRLLHSAWTWGSFLGWHPARLLLAELMRGWISSQPDPLPLQPQANVLMRGKQAAVPFWELLVVGRGTGTGSPAFPALD